jgi:hypothetical protein
MNAYVWSVDATSGQMTRTEMVVFGILLMVFGGVAMAVISRHVQPIRSMVFGLLFFIVGAIMCGAGALTHAGH